jgi:serine phosphatase RsbU (regulator of sigma subunit)
MIFKGIKIKMTAAIIGAVLSSATLLTVVTIFLVSYTVKLSLKTRAKETSKILTQALEGRQRQQVIRTEIVAQDNDFQTAYAFKEAELERLQKDLSERLAKLSGCAALITDLDRKMVTTAENKCPTKGSALLEAVALAKARKSSASQATIERIENQLFFVSSVPIKRYDVQTLGFVTISVAFDRSMLSQLKEAAGADVVLVSEGTIQDSTTTLTQGLEHLKALAGQFVKDDLLTIDGLVSSTSGSLISWALPLRAEDKLEGVLVFALSSKDASELQRQLLGSSLGLTLLTTLLAVMLGLLIARRIADPIVEIEHSFREIAASGDLSRRIDKPYTDEVGQMASSFNQMQGQIEQLHARVVNAERRMHGELMMASAVQEMLFPQTVIDGVRCQFASHSQTSSETGGDWYTIFNSPEHQVTTVIVSDVTGHGAASALVTAIIHGFFKATQEEISALPAGQWQAGVDHILKRLNATVIESTRRSLASSLLLLTFDHRTLKGRYANAGHLAPILLHRQDGKATVSIITTQPSALIGDVPNPTFSWGEFQFSPEQLFLLYTDGLIECTNTNQEMYGFKRLRRMMLGLVQQDARTVRDAVLKDAMDFFGDQPRNDDITLVVGRVR